jgi:hypothetical protein
MAGQLSPSAVPDAVFARLLLELGGEIFGASSFGLGRVLEPRLAALEHLGCSRSLACVDEVMAVLAGGVEAISRSINSVLMVRWCLLAGSRGEGLRGYLLELCREVPDSNAVRLLALRAEECPEGRVRNASAIVENVAAGKKAIDAATSHALAEAVRADGIGVHAEWVLRCLRIWFRGNSYAVPRELWDLAIGVVDGGELVEIVVDAWNWARDGQATVQQNVVNRIEEIINTRPELEATMVQRTGLIGQERQAIKKSTWGGARGFRRAESH